MRPISALLSVLVCSTLALPAAAQQQPRVPRTATSSAREEARGNGVTMQVTTNRTFRFVTYPFGEDTTVLLEEEATQASSRQLEGSQGTVRTTAWLKTGGAFSRRLWRLEAEALAPETWGSFYRVTRPGCCSETSVGLYHDLRTGREIFGATLEPAAVYLEEGGDAFFAFRAVEGAGPIPELPDAERERVKGVLYFASASSVLSAATIALAGRATDVLLVSFTAGREGAAVRVHFDDGTLATVPIRGGRPAWRQAALPAGVTLTPLARRAPAPRQPQP
jgi:hypothetical protein